MILLDEEVGQLGCIDASLQKQLLHEFLDPVVVIVSNGMGLEVYNDLLETNKKGFIIQVPTPETMFWT